MPEYKDTQIPESGLWIAGIEQLEVTDQARGYDPKTGIDGPANKQWEALANRTSYLKELFEADHDVDGKHLVKDKDFLPETRIPEKSIDLAHSSVSLAEGVVSLSDAIDATRKDLDDGDSSGDLALTLAMTKLIPLSWQYSGNKYAFDLFTDSMSLRSSKEYVVTKAVAGDDSIDVVNTAGLVPGDVYVLTDPTGEHYQIATIAYVLSSTRVLISEPVKVTMGYGFFRATNVPADNFMAKATKDFIYLSDYVDAFADSARTELHIKHTPETGAVITVSYSTGRVWFPLPRDRREEYADLQSDVYSFPAGIGRCRIRIYYQGLSKETIFSSIMFISERSQEWIEDIYCPSIIEAVRSGTEVAVSASWYGSLYDETQAGVQVQFAEYEDFTDVLEEFDEPYPVTAVFLSSQYQLSRYVRIRYYDVNGTYSRWSQPKFITNSEA